MGERTVVLAPDKFKGCLGSREVSAALATGLREVAPGVRIRVVPVADGGDGTVAALLDRTGWEALDVVVTGPDGAPVRAQVARRGTTAVVESAATSGLALLWGRPLRPLTASSRGVGEAIAAAVDAGARDVVVGIGGTACTDGGAGMLAALGAAVLDPAGRPVPDGGGGLARVATVDLTPARRRLAGVTLTVATDVDNALLGADGAAAVYGPQKGADADDVRLLDDALRHWADLVGGDPAAAGAGAGGGLGYGLVAGLGGTVRSGVDLVLELMGFAEEVRGADLVVTGEGRLDEQSLRGKVVVGVLRAAGMAGPAGAGRVAGPAGTARAGEAAAVTGRVVGDVDAVGGGGPLVVAVCGVDLLGPEATESLGLARVWSLVERATSPEDSIARAPELLRSVGRELVGALAL